MKYKLIVTDMDGTLLSNHKEITKENKKALKKATEMGAKVAIATGRIYTSARYYANLLELDAPIIACNGAIIREEKTNNTLYKNTMNKDDCKKVANICDEFGIYYHFYNDTGFYCKELKYSSLQYSKWNETQTEENRVNIKVMDDPIKFIQNTEDILKFVVIDDDLDKLDKVRKELEKIDNIEVSKSWHNNIEVMNNGVSKGQAVKKLAEHFGFKQDEIITFGDNFNDLSMIEYAGMGVAMGNSEDKVKEKANLITDSNERSGVAKALNELLNIKY
ncbi:Cof-type HAD-IIB family hydrolase [Tepidibacter sp. Z1-5]|uniref:Cof-type HAD-IIB family hydrolase n=1 Tax=Tepidibacter sp. Z1-5 TaxID=3134138 RepID=UPI0030BB172A